MRIEDPDTLRWEDEIIFVEDPAGLPYVREILGSAGTRRGRPPFRDHRLIAYAALKPNSPCCVSRRFERRMWYVSDWDPYPGGPCEAVEPTSLKAGTPSVPYGRWKPLTGVATKDEGSR
jgi:hypothetical protein